jgi:hypothetical protein
MYSAASVPRIGHPPDLGIHAYCEIPTTGQYLDSGKAGRTEKSSWLSVDLSRQGLLS